MMAPRRLLGFGFCLLAACTGSEPGEGCRDSLECSEVERCALPGTAPVCGIPCPLRRDCESNDDCDGDAVCVELVATCCNAGELSSACRPSCATAGCVADERCRDDGRCEPTPCNDGFTCGAHTHCDPTSTGADAHGCARDACEDDGDCEGGFCLSGACYETLGTCQNEVVP